MEDESFSALEEELKRFSPAILAQFEKAAPIAMERLSSRQLQQWAG